MRPALGRGSEAVRRSQRGRCLRGAWGAARNLRPASAPHPRRERPPRQQQTLRREHLAPWVMVLQPGPDRLSQLRPCGDSSWNTPSAWKGEGASGPLDPGGRWPAGTQPCAATPLAPAARLLNGLHVPSPSHAELRTDTGQRGTWRARPAGGRLDGELVAAQTRDIPVNETDRADTSRYVRVSTANLTRLELTRHVLVTPQFKTTNTRK